MKKHNLMILGITVILSMVFTVNEVKSQTTPANIAKPTVNTYSNIQYTTVGALDVVSNPSKYLYKSIRIRGKFDKFSTLGLDYPAAMRNSEKYISFLIQRPDITDHNIPLSELKIFLKKEIAEKHIDLDAGDIVEFTGKVFSTALGDAWMDVDTFTVISKKKTTKNDGTK